MNLDSRLLDSNRGHFPCSTLPKLSLGYRTQTGEISSVLVCTIGNISGIYFSSKIRCSLLNYQSFAALSVFYYLHNYLICMVPTISVSVVHLFGPACLWSQFV